ncbi:hypothetical protein [Actinomadura sp. 6N118]|uniref:hypothetical protein n=1 Tax=Actinomadura sp. 6N118 TaxID=3375151 RepID=UPI0037B3D885
MNLIEHPALRGTLLAGLGCNDARLLHDDGWRIVGDPTEGALLTPADQRRQGGP